MAFFRLASASFLASSRMRPASFSAEPIAASACCFRCSTPDCTPLRSGNRGTHQQSHQTKHCCQCPVHRLHVYALPPLKSVLYLSICIQHSGVLPKAACASCIHLCFPTVGNSPQEDVHLLPLSALHSKSAAFSVPPNRFQTASHKVARRSLGDIALCIDVLGRIMRIIDNPIQNAVQDRLSFLYAVRQNPVPHGSQVHFQKKSGFPHIAETAFSALSEPIAGTNLPADGIHE